MSSVSTGFRLQYLDGPNTMLGDVQFFVDTNMIDYQTYTVSLSALASLGTISRLGFKGPFESTGDSVYIKSIILNKFVDCGSCNVDLDNDGVCDNSEVLGCTDSEANNYNSLATEEDESCDYSIPASLISDCDDFIVGAGISWPYVLEATTIADGSSSQAAQTFTMNITSLPEGGANFRVFKTTANGSNYFGNLTALQIGNNTFTVTAVDFDRVVKFQFSSGYVEFNALSLNGVYLDCLGLSLIHI